MTSTSSCLGHLSQTYFSSPDAPQSPTPKMDCELKFPVASRIGVPGTWTCGDMVVMRKTTLRKPYHCMQMSICFAYNVQLLRKGKGPEIMIVCPKATVPMCSTPFEKVAI